MPLTITPNNINIVVIASTVDAVVSDEIELNPHYKYTLMCTTLTGVESIPVSIYDLTTDTFIPMMVAGARVRMIKDYEILTFADTAAVIKISKPVTATACGITLMYR